MSHMFASAKTVYNRITCILHSAIHTSPIPNNIPPSHIPHPASKPMKIPHTCIHHMNMYQPPPEPSNQKLPCIPFTPHCCLLSNQLSEQESEIGRQEQQIIIYQDSVDEVNIDTPLSPVDTPLQGLGKLHSNCIPNNIPECQPGP